MLMANKGNSDLSVARVNKADEFYTAYEDIATEMKYYTDCFRNKVVYCPCDSYDSNFYIFFRDNFYKLGLKQLIATSYNPDGNGFRCEYDGLVDSHLEIECSGSFSDEYCVDILNTADIVVTNPPFSKFREFISLLTKYEKDFIILGNINAVSYSEVFPYIINRVIKIGPSIRAGDRNFRVPDEYELTGTACSVGKDGTKYIRVKGVRWFTNVQFDDFKIKHTVLTKKYDSGEYDIYDTYPAVNVNSIKEIPFDYSDMLGVPITALDKMNCDGVLEFIDESGQKYLYAVCGQLNSGNNVNYDFAKPIIDGKCKFKRIVIKKLD